MNISAAETTGALTHQANTQGTPELNRAAQRDENLPKTQRFNVSQPKDRVEFTDASKVLAVLSEQADDGAELQLPPDKLRELVHG